MARSATDRGRSWILVVGAGVTAILVVGAAVMRVGVDRLTEAALLADLVPVLFATALLLLALLALLRLPGLAWASLALAAPLAALEVFGVVRLLDATASGSAGRELTLIGGLALVGAVGVDAVYAGRRFEHATGPTRLAILVVGVGAIATLGSVAWALLDSSTPGSSPADVTALTPLRIAGRIAAATIVGGLSVGLARQLAPAVMRAAARSRAEHANAAGGPPLWGFLGLLADELLPARTVGRREVAEAERARLAADLHAHVLPELRRAAAAAESAGLPPELRVDLRRALEDVEQLMHQRQSIVLDQFGLVAALEWLAERTEERSPLRVQLELDGAVPDSPTAVDPTVARAAFRIALLGLDNVVRHAGASIATLRLSGDVTGLRLTVADDGTSRATLEQTGGRGLSDMRAAADESGGSIRFVGGTGVQIDAAWPAAPVARNHAPSRAPLADRSEGPAS